MTTAKPTVVALMTVEQVAEVLQFSTFTVEGLIRSGELRRFALSDRDAGRKGPGKRGYRIHPDDLAAFINSRRRVETRPTEAPASAPAPPRVLLPIATGTDGKSRLRRPKGR